MVAGVVSLLEIEKPLEGSLGIRPGCVSPPGCCWLPRAADGEQAVHTDRLQQHCRVMVMSRVMAGSRATSFSRATAGRPGCELPRCLQGQNLFLRTR